MVEGDFKTLLWSTDRSSGQKLSREMLALTDTINQTNRTFHPNTTEYTFFSEPQDTFSKTDHKLRHKMSLNRYKKTEIISSIYYCGLELGINNSRRKVYKLMQTEQLITE